MKTYKALIQQVFEFGNYKLMVLYLTELNMEKSAKETTVDTNTLS
jgi:hypothetical protein